MSFDLIDVVGQALSGETGKQLGALTGIDSPSLLQGAVQSALPALLGGLATKASTPSGAGELFDALSRGNHDNLLGNIGSALMGNASSNSLISAGAALLPMLFGNRLGPVTDLLTQKSGVSRSATTSLLSAVAPLAMGFVTKRLRSGGGFNVAGLTDLLLGQRSFLEKAAPAGLAGALGLGSLGDIGRTVSAAMAPPPASVEPERKSSIWTWLIPLLALLALFLLFRGCEQKPAAPAAEAPAAPAAAPAPAPAVAVVGDLLERALPDGTVIRVLGDGVEDRLIAFLTDANRAVDKDTWFTFDRLEFETGSATLSAASSAQLDSIAAILRAFPAAKLKIGGYTDNTGDPAANLALSGQRAEAAAREIAARGIAPDRLESEGYGEQFPVADNATEEGRQRNRRIDVRVTAK
jgi:outer membrane protein OmpA-like peptidoglycan-associated protein